jgi:hypothetical protein
MTSRSRLRHWLLPSQAPRLGDGSPSLYKKQSHLSNNAEINYEALQEAAHPPAAHLPGGDFQVCGD